MKSLLIDNLKRILILQFGFMKCRCFRKTASNLNIAIIFKFYELEGSLGSHIISHCEVILRNDRMSSVPTQVN
jgi:hypothetical protein